MGCDIHVKTFVHSKVENKMIPLTSALEDTYSTDPIVGYRDYDLFGLFGNNMRSSYPELDCFELMCDFPDFMKGTTLGAIIDNPDYHTRRWCWADKLKASLLEYKKCLEDPKKWIERFDDENDLALDAIEGKLKMSEYKNLHKPLVASINGVVMKIGEVVSRVSDKEEFLDPNKVAFVTWMDS